MLGETQFVGDTQLVNRAQSIAGRRVYPVAKRALDIGVCLVLLPLALILIAAISFAIYIDSPGPVIFVQERVGQSGRRFRMFKFRTMRRGADHSASREFMRAFVAGRICQDTVGRVVFKPVSHAHVTRIGRVLRRTSLDELPQVFNVLRGEMSLIGPRPNVPWEVEAYQDWHKQRLNARPGITGLAQVRGRSSINFDSIVRYDIEYIRKQSLKLDLQILWWTIKSVVSRHGAG